jgi:hypothetical protein
MHVCATLGSTATRLRRKNKIKIKKKIKKVSKEKGHKAVIFHVCAGRFYSTDCSGSLRIGLGHQRNQSGKFLWL